MDCRFIWLSECISTVLGIFDRKYSDTLIDEHLEEFKSFFNDDVIDFSENSKQLLFIWRTFYDKLVEETITVLEEGKKCFVFSLFLLFLMTSIDNNNSMCVFLQMPNIQLHHRHRRLNRPGKKEKAKVSQILVNKSNKTKLKPNKKNNMLLAKIRSFKKLFFFDNKQLRLVCRHCHRQMAVKYISLSVIFVQSHHILSPSHSVSPSFNPDPVRR